MLNFLDARERLLSMRRQCHFPSKAVQRCRKHCHADGYESEVSKPVARLGDSGFRKTGFASPSDILSPLPGEKQTPQFQLFTNDRLWRKADAQELERYPP